VPLFPLPAPVTVLIDGRPLPAYERAYVTGGRVFAPLGPMLLQVADRVWYDGDALVVERDGRRVRILVEPDPFDRLETTYVAAGPLLRALGETVRYRRGERRLEVLTPATIVESPEPFNPAVPAASPRPVFTAAPLATARPLWTGSPLPRRTPLPNPPPRG